MRSEVISQSSSFPVEANSKKLAAKTRVFSGRLAQPPSVKGSEKGFWQLNALSPRSPSQLASVRKRFSRKVAETQRKHFFHAPNRTACFSLRLGDFARERLFLVVGWAIAQPQQPFLTEDRPQRKHACAWPAEVTRTSSISSLVLCASARKGSSSWLSSLPDW